MPNCVFGMKYSDGSIGTLSTLFVASNALFHETFTTFSTAGVTIHLCSPTRNCAFVFVSTENRGIWPGTTTLALSQE